MLEIARADFFRLRVILGVVIAIRKTQPALTHTDNHGVGVIRVLLRAAVAEQGIPVENAPQVIEIIFVQLRIDVPTDLVGRNGVLLLPASTGVTVEINARVYRAVHRGNVKAGDVGQRGPTLTLGCTGRIAGTGPRRCGLPRGLLSESCCGDETE